jgi:hypothetical protein
MICCEFSPVVDFDKPEDFNIASGYNSVNRMCHKNTRLIALLSMALPVFPQFKINGGVHEAMFATGNMFFDQPMV